MRVFRYILSALFVLLLAVPCPAGSSVVQLFSGPAVSVWDLFPKLEDAFREKGSVVQVPSPNGKNKLVFPSGWGEDDTDEYTFFAVNERRRYPIHIDGYVQPHVIWANDSSAALFFFSNGGANCCYETKLISSDGEHVNVTDPTRQVADDFIAYRDKLGLRCEVPHEYPNLYPIGFLDRSHAFIAAETVHHSICDCFGSFRAYEIDLPSGRIVKAFNQAVAKRMFDGNLPWDLGAAPNDDWDINPRSCASKR